jgi:Domain of unknown function (DUF4249)
MKQFTQLLLAALPIIALTACRKEITLDLKNESNKVVIEAIITEGPGPHTVQLTRSLGFDASNTFPAISNATVTLSDDQGNSEQLTGTGPGIYTAATLEGLQERTYQLNALVDGTAYTAQCRMPVPVPMDTLMIDSFPSFGTYTKIIIPGYMDPAGVANYYRFIVVVNGEKQDGISLENDRFTDGNVVFQPLFMNGLELESGDQVQVTMECIASEVYDYFFTMSQNGANGATPADPVSNISGGALGYFSVRTSSTRSVVVP